jgi:hypothetical protein
MKQYRIVLSEEEYRLLSDILNQYGDNPDMMDEEAGDFDLLWQAVIKDREMIDDALFMGTKRYHKRFWFPSWLSMLVFKSRVHNWFYKEPY